MGRSSIRTPSSSSSSVVGFVGSVSRSQTTTTSLGDVSSLRQCMIRLFVSLALLTIVLDFYFLVWSNQTVVSSRPVVWMNHQAAAAAASGAGVTAAATTTSGVTTGADVAASFQQDPVVTLFNASGISLDTETLKRLPSWKHVTELYGTHPIMIGFQPSSSSSSAISVQQQQQEQSLSSFQASCIEYQKRVPGERRMLGAAGMFSTGTNLITTLLKNNCQIPERVIKYGINATREQYGIRWQVPWGKHTPAHFREIHAATHATEINKEDILPIITIRNPYWWMKSMCKNPYTTHWHVRRKNKCPDLRIEHENHHDKQHQPQDVDDLPWNNVTVKYGAGSEQYQSLVHLFNDWYHEYTQHANYPWVMIRMEDLIFHPQATVTAVCECAGGRIRTDRPFTFTIESAKADSPGHDTSTGLVEAWVKYGQPLPPAAGFRESDYESSLEALDQNLMDLFHYQHAPPALLPI